MSTTASLVNEDEVAAVSALYGATRADNAALMNTALALVGVGATYAVATLAFADTFGVVINWYIVAALPFLMWMIAAFHSLLTVVTMVNAVTIQVLEKRLEGKSGLHADVRAVIGYSATEKIMHIEKSGWAHKLATVVTYVGVAVLVIGYTVYVLVDAADHIGVSVWWYVAAYAALAVVTGSSWWTGMRQAGENARAARL